MIKYFFASLISFLVLVYSCSSPRHVYAPSPPNNPYFTKKGESKLAVYSSGGPARGGANSGTKSKNRGFDLQSAYAIGNNWALTAGYFSRKERDVYPNYRYNYFDSSVVNYSRHITDFGGGYFVPLDKAQTVFFNIYGGLGFGKFSFIDNGIDKSRTNYGRFHNSAVLKWYLQPSFSAFAGDYFRASFIGKFSFVHYGNISTSYTNEELNYFFLNKIRNKTVVFIEPTFNMQFGIPPCDWLKIDGGLTFSSDPFDKVSRIKARGFNASIGLSVDFSKLKKSGLTGHE